MSSVVSKILCKSPSELLLIRYLPTVLLNCFNILVIIDGVAERKTARMLRMNLEARLDFFCYVQVVANYVLAFEMASQQSFDVIVLPRKNSIEGFATKDFIEDVGSVVGFNAAIVPTVDHDSAAHVFGKTVRSSAGGSDGYMVDDLVAAIESAVKKSPLVSEDIDLAERPSGHGTSLPKSNKRSHRDVVDATHGPASEHPSKRSSHHQYSPSAEELADLQYCELQWQMRVHAQAQAQALQGQRYPKSHLAATTVVTDGSAATISPTSSTSVPSPLSNSSVRNPLPHHSLHPHEYSHYHNMPYQALPFHLFSLHQHPYPAPYPGPYPYTFSMHPAFSLPAAQGYHAYTHPHHHSVRHMGDHHHQEKEFSQAQEVHGHYPHQQQNQNQKNRAVCGTGSTTGAGEDRRLTAASVPVVSWDGHHHKSSFTRPVELHAADTSSEDSCTTRDSLDSLSLDDTPVVELLSDYHEANYGCDSIDGAEFASCFDVDNWI